MDTKNLKDMYKTILSDHFPPKLRIIYDFPESSQELIYEKVSWEIGDEIKGLRYGDNPGQEAAMYKLVNGNLMLGELTTIPPGKALVSDPDLKRFGKHPGKTNLTDVDNALNILRYLAEKPACAIMKHNNPSGVAQSDSLVNAYLRADIADRIAAFGGAIVLNRTADKDTAKAISERYAEVVAAPDYEEGSLEILAKRKNLRIMKIGNIERLQEWVGQQYVNFKSLIDGGLIVETAFIPKLAIDPNAWAVAEAQHKEKTYKIEREPTKKELEDMRFGWLVEAGVTSNSVIFAKDNATVAIGTGEQDRVGVVEIAVYKAYVKYRDALCFKETAMPYAVLEQEIREGKTELENLKEKFNEETKAANAGLKGSIMVSDAFFPFRDGVDAGIKEGITGIIQPGGSERDFESIVACNEAGVTMIYTGQRSFKH